MSCGHITLVTRGGTTEVRVQGWAGRLEGFLIESANVCDHPTAANWPSALKKAIDARRRELGVTKGRVLYAFQIHWPSGQRIPVGALLYHLEAKQIRVLNLGTSLDVGLLKGPTLVLLLACAQEVARHHNCDRLEWLVHGDANGRSARKDFGFRRVRKADRRQRKLRANEVLLERSHRP